MASMYLDAMDEVLYNFVGDFIAEREVVLENGTNGFGLQNLKGRKKWHKL